MCQIETFAFVFGKSFQTAMATNLATGTSYHLQTDGLTVHLNLVVMEVMLKVRMLDYYGSWENHMPFV